VQENITMDLPSFTLEYLFNGPGTPDSDDYLEIEAMTRLFLTARIEENLRQESLVIAKDSFAEVDGPGDISGYPISISFSPKLIFHSAWIAIPTEEELDVILVEMFLGRSLMEYIAILQRLDPTNAFSATTTVIFNRNLSSQPYSVRDSSSDSSIAGISAGAITLLILSVWAISMKRRREKRPMLKDSRTETITCDVTSLARESDSGDEEEGVQKTMTESSTFGEDDDDSENDEYTYADECNEDESYASFPSYGFQLLDEKFSLAESVSVVSKDPTTPGPIRDEGRADNDTREFLLAGPCPSRRLSVESKRVSHRDSKTKLHSWLVDRRQEEVSVRVVETIEEEAEESISEGDVSSLTETDRRYYESYQEDQETFIEESLGMEQKRAKESDLIHHELEEIGQPARSDEFAAAYSFPANLATNDYSELYSESKNQRRTTGESVNQKYFAVHTWLANLKNEQVIIGSDAEGESYTEAAGNYSVAKGAHPESRESVVEEGSDYSEVHSWLTELMEGGSNDQSHNLTAKADLDENRKTSGAVLMSTFEPGSDQEEVNIGPMKQSLIDLRPSSESVPEQMDEEHTHLSHRGRMTTRGKFASETVKEKEYDQGATDTRASLEDSNGKNSRKSNRLVEELKERLEVRERTKPNFDLAAVESNRKSRVFPERRLMKELKEKLNDRSNSINNEVQMGSNRVGSEQDEASQADLPQQTPELSEVDGEYSKLTKYPWNKIKEGGKDKEKCERPSVVVDFIAPGYTPANRNSDGSDLQSRYKEDILKDQRKKMVEDEQSLTSLPSYKARLPVTIKKEENVPWWLPDESSSIDSRPQPKRRSTIWEDEEDTSCQDSTSNDGSSTTSSYYSETTASNSSYFGRILPRSK
jgi:hypothetical protein